MNRSNIKALELTDPSFICLAPQLTNLKSLSLRLDQKLQSWSKEDQMLQFVLDCPPLERLTGFNFYYGLHRTILAHLGSTLQELSLVGGHSISVKKIRNLRVYCPNLRSLGLSIDLEEHWVRFKSRCRRKENLTAFKPPKILTAIAEDLTAVSDLRLHIEIPGMYWKKWCISLKWVCYHIRVADVWSYLWTRREKTRKAALPCGRATQLKTLRLSGPFVTSRFVNDRKVPFQHSLAMSLGCHTCVCHQRSPPDFQDNFERGELEICLSVRDDELNLGIATITNLDAARDRRLLRELDEDGAEKEELSYVERVIPKLSTEQEDAEDRELRQRTLLEFFRPLNL